MRKSFSTSNEQIEQIIRSSFFPLYSDSHKGQHGKVGIIGGSKEYTGAPYFAAISSLRLGSDIVHVFCPKDVSVVIKSFSPDLIVHPLLDDDKERKNLESWLAKMHSVVVGPGLGDDSKIQNIVYNLIQFVKSQNIPIVIDADGLRLITLNKDLLLGYKKAVLTPNKNEFSRMCFSFGIKEEEGFNSVHELCTHLNGPLIIRKGKVDLISDLINSLKCDTDGSMRRCGGQGDLLSGFLGTLMAWADEDGVMMKTQKQPLLDETLKNMSSYLKACFTGCHLVRKLSKSCFQEIGRGMITEDMIRLIPRIIKDF